MRIGLVGCGKIGWRHLDAYRQLGVEDIVVYDANPAAARHVGQEFGVRVVDTLSDLLAWPDLVAVDVCVPTPFHYDTVMLALQNRKHVFCEKPLAETVKQVQTVMEAAASLGRVVQVGFLYRFFPSLYLLKDLLSRGILGTPHHAIFRLGGRGSAAVWKHSATSGGGAVFEMLVHMLDLATWLFGRVERPRVLVGDTVLPRRQIGGTSVVADAEDYVVVRLKSSQTDILCESDLITPSFMNYVEVQGGNGSAFASSLHYLPTIVYLKEARGIYNQGNNFLKFPMINAMVEQLRTFLVACETGVSQVNSVADSLRVIALIEEIKEQLVARGDS